MKILSTLLTLVALGGAALAFSPQEEKKAAEASAPTDEQIIQEQVPSYPFDTCIVSDEPLDAMGKPLDIVHEGRLVRLCCKGCIRQFKKNPAKTFAAVDAAIQKQQGPSYPLTSCAVSGEPLDAMGGPISLIHGTRLVKLCCKGCVKGFKKDPAKHMAKVDAALIKAQMKDYPLDTCLMRGSKLEGEGQNILYGTQLVRLCCKRCVAGFQKAEDKSQFLSKLNRAYEAKRKG